MSGDTDVTTIEMTVVEEHRLLELEEVVSAGMETFVAVGNALSEINESKLFRATHDTFAAYIQDRWQMTRGRAYQLMSAAHVSTVVDDAGLPSITSERQARELAGLDDEDVVDIFAAATTTSPAPTAAIVRAHRDQHLPLAGAQRRRPLPDAFRTQLHRTAKAAESLVRVTEDDRWGQNLAALAGGNLGDLKRTIEGLQAVYDALESGVPGPSMTVTMVVGLNTATITAPPHLQSGVRRTLADVGTKWQTNRRTKQIAFPARFADRVVDRFSVWRGPRLVVEREA